MSAHEILGVEPGATPEEIEAAFRRAAMRTHPDRDGGSEQAFMRVRQAYDELTGKAPVQSEDDQAAMVLRDILSQVLAGNATNILSACRERVQVMLNQIAMGRSGATIAKGNLTKRRSKVRAKDDAPNIVHQMIDHLLLGIENDLREMDRRESINRAVLRMLDGYEEDAEMAVASFMLGTGTSTRVWA